MTDWATISSLATAGGTLVLGVATFSSVRSSNRMARTADRALKLGLRPVLFPSRPDDAAQQIKWGDGHWASLEGAGSVLEEDGDAIYLAISLRNVGSGIAVLHGWHLQSASMSGVATQPDVASFRPQGRDLYVPAGDISFWQAAIRTSDDPSREVVEDAVHGHHGLLLDLLYGDHEGGQRTISRFSLTPVDLEGKAWHCSVVRHWSLDFPNPRNS